MMCANWHSKLARSQAARPAVDTGGRTWFDILPPLLDCDTKSHADTLRIEHHAAQHCELGEITAQQAVDLLSQVPTEMRADVVERLAPRIKTVVKIMRADGQGTLSYITEKRL